MKLDADVMLRATHHTLSHSLAARKSSTCPMPDPAPASMTMTGISSEKPRPSPAPDRSWVPMGIRAFRRAVATSSPTRLKDEDRTIH